MLQKVFENDNMKAWINHDNGKILSISYYREGGTAVYFTPSDSEWDIVYNTVRNINPDEFDKMFCNKK